MSLTIHAASAFQRLKAPEFDAFREHLEEEYHKALVRMSEIVDAEQWRRLQGRAQLAKELLDLVESSGDLVAKLSRLQQ